MGSIRKMKEVGPVKIIGGLTAGVAIAALFAFLFGKLVQLLWNATISDIFEIKEISYWQAVGLLLLARILVGGMGHGAHPHKHHKKFKDHWKCNGRTILEEQAKEE